MSIDEAARRRDFTINAISWDPLTGDYEDPFDGRGDLARRVLRAVDPETFGDDSLRVLRAIQFAARFEFTLDEDTRGAVPRDSARRSAGGADLGRDREAAAPGRTAVDSGSRWRSTSASSIACCPRCGRSSAASRSRSGIPKATSGSHTLMVIDEARARERRPRSPAADHGDARRRVPRPRQAGDDGVHRRPHPIARSRAGRRRADRVAARSAERPHHRRLRRAARRSSASSRST